MNGVWLRVAAALLALAASMSAQALGRYGDDDSWLTSPCGGPPDQRPVSCPGAVRPAPPPPPVPLQATPPPGTLVPSVPAAATPATPAAPQPIQVTLESGRAKSIKFTRIRSSMRDGDRLGEIRSGNTCAITYPVTMESRIEAVVLAGMVRPLRDEFSRAGYLDPVGDRGLFEEEADQARVDLQLGAMVEDVNLDYCTIANGARTNGKVRVRVRWQLFDPIARKVLYTKITEGSSQTIGPEAIRDSELVGRAYRQTVRALLADQKFFELAVDNGTPAAAAAPDLHLHTLKKLPARSGSLTSNMTIIRAAVVTVANPSGSGSGFFVGEDGYVVTNSHVVAGNRFVRVKLATGRELVGEVLKRDTERDVALIKTEGNKFVALPLAAGDASVGGEVTLIGSPLGETLSGTVTRGIISAYRTFNGKRFIQSDVSLLPGNSGGPLLDSDGKVIGIAVMGYFGAGGGRLNFFVPIQEALERLDLRVAP